MSYKILTPEEIFLLLNHSIPKASYCMGWAVGVCLRFKSISHPCLTGAKLISGQPITDTLWENTGTQIHAFLWVQHALSIVDNDREFKWQSLLFRFLYLITLVSLSYMTRRTKREETLVNYSDSCGQTGISCGLHPISDIRYKDSVRHIADLTAVTWTCRHKLNIN